MRATALLIMSAVCVVGCLRVKMDPVEVKPITLNVNLKVDRELDDFFAFEKQMGSTTAPTTAPATRPAM